MVEQASRLPSYGKAQADVCATIDETSFTNRQSFVIRH
jgi:hypothetical protein